MFTEHKYFEASTFHQVVLKLQVIIILQDLRRPGALWMILPILSTGLAPHSDTTAPLFSLNPGLTVGELMKIMGK